MKKQQEMTDPASCLNKAHDNEMLFVLLGRDPAAPYVIRCWIEERIRLGKNAIGDPKMLDAQACAAAMEESYSAGEDHDSRGIHG